VRLDLEAAPDRDADRKLAQPLDGAVSFILTFAVVLLVACCS
jgi:hypothetical protein